MQKAIDWLELWRELAARQEKSWLIEGAKDAEEMWRKKAKGFAAEVKRRWAKPDSSREFITAQLQANPGWTALDIGGGTGAWAALMAGSARHVTVVEPATAMVEIMRSSLADAKVENVEIVQQRWPDAKVEKHDLVLCSHAMYGFADFAELVRSIETVTRRLCVLIMRSPTPEDLLSIAALHIWGQPYDSPNAQIAFNAMLQMGIFPNVLMEDTGLWDPWASASLDEAFSEAKRRLDVQDTGRYDEYLRNLLSQNLVCREGKVEWPRSIRTMLLHWSPR
jgi:2-polyprenyl-3-methyl-5-hydroxy-6-metoxy-1,4-benzoquinol methylase